MALRVVAPGVGAPATGWRRADPPPDARITEARRKVLDALAQHEPRATGDLTRAAGVGAGVVRGMADAGLLVPAVLPIEPPFVIPDPEHPGQVLAPDQAAAAATLRQAVAARAFSVTLLDGVTGSGKTEVYLEAVAECLRQGRQALVLLPEIALSSQWLERFERRFGVAPAVWHSDLTSRRAARHLARGGRRRGAGGGRRALGAVPAVPRPRPGRDRRGARDRVQAGGGRGLPRPRHGGGARPLLRGAGGAGVRHAVPGDAGQRRGRPLSPASPCRRGMAAPCCPRWPP